MGQKPVNRHKKMGYEPRFYRDWTKHNPLLFFSLCEKETDLLIYSDKNLAAEATTLAQHYRKQIEEIIRVFPQFLTSLKPVVEIVIIVI